VAAEPGADPPTPAEAAAAGMPATEPGPPAPAVSSAPAPPSPPPPPDLDLEVPADPAARLARADQLIDEMVAAYRDAPAMTDHIHVESTFGNQQVPPEETVMHMGSGADLYMKTTSNEVTVVNGIMFLSMNASPDRFMKIALIDDVLTTLRENFGRYGGVMAQLALRYEKSREEILYNLSFGLPDQPRISGYRIITDTDGRTLEQISLISRQGSTTVNVDPATKLIVRADVDYQDVDAPVANFRIGRTLTFDPKVHDELPQPVEFVPGDRIAVRTLEALRKEADADTVDHLAVSVGDPAPEFALHSVLGEKVSLADHAGSVVVLLFWADWSVTCRTILPQFHEFAVWAEESGKPIEAIAVNVLGKPDEKAGTWERVFEVWSRDQYAMPCLLDSEGSVSEAYGVTGVPLFMVIDPRGRIFRADFQTGSRLVARLQEQALAALEDDG
jgi:peroxiredoxin